MKTLQQVLCIEQFSDHVFICRSKSYQLAIGSWQSKITIDSIKFG